ncbi:SH3 domain-containing protein [Actinacidiphila oryziradicis]|uniref:SH3 domain-containing protein n=2 Tax=Actinacidiphila oryziradicis TaxID=2571141 RepID=A0A4U0RWU6_9ACTN|nr:SH3 domain-containing protein [Actinacidiphila oryziradicis]
MLPPPRVAAAAMALAIVNAAGTAAAATPADGVDVSDECHKHPPKAPYELHARSANLRSLPSPSAPVLGVVYPGHRIKATGERHGWVWVEDKTSGVSGWASIRLIYRDVVMCLD